MYLEFLMRVNAWKINMPPMYMQVIRCRNSLLFLIIFFAKLACSCGISLASICVWSFGFLHAHANIVSPVMRSHACYYISIHACTRTRYHAFICVFLRIMFDWVSIAYSVCSLNNRRKLFYFIYFRFWGMRVG